MPGSRVNSKAMSRVGAGLIARAGSHLGSLSENYWHFMNWRRPEGCDCVGCRFYRTTNESLHEQFQSRIDCLNKFLAWEEAMPNLVTTEGGNDMLTQYLKGASYTAAFYVGLVNNAGFTTYAITDVAAQIGGTNGWAEGVPYSNSTRPAWVGGTAAAKSIDNLASLAVFNINATLTVRGGFLSTSSVKSGTAGKLFGAADFDNGSRALLSGDTLNVKVTCTV